MKYFSMFSGIGGFEYGINQAWQNKSINRFATKQSTKEKSLRQDGDKSLRVGRLGNGRGSSPICIGYSEIDKYAIKVYERRFSGHTNYGDATKINPTELPDFDLLVGGFPCQAFSIAGKRKGFDDTRGTLFFDIARILAEKKPKHLVLENVKGLLSHDQGRTFQTILGILADLGYRVEWQVLNSKDFGVPQNRERIIIVGHLRGTSRPEVFPITGTDSKDIEQLNTPKHSNDRVYGTDGISPTLNTMQGGNRQPFITTHYGHKSKPAKHSQISPTLKAQSHGHEPMVNNNTQIRRLTPVECERLQGFPDNWTALGVNDEPISDTQRYKMCGNAVTTNVITAVMEKLYVI